MRPWARWVGGVLLTMGLAGWVSDKLNAGWPFAAWALVWLGYSLWRGRRSLLPIWLPWIPWYAWLLRRLAREYPQPDADHAWPQAVARPAGDVTVYITRPHLADPSRPLRLSVAGVPQGLGPGVEVRIEGLGSKVAKALGLEDVTTGDATLDSRLLLQGRRDAVLAALDAQTRSALLRLTERWNVRIAADRFEIETRRPLVGPGQLREATEELIGLARRSAARGPMFTRLRENALSDPIPEVRANNLDMVMRDKKRGPAVLRAALHDPSEKVRLRAALGLGREGQAALLALAMDPKTAEDCAAAAVCGLGDALSESQALAILRDALGQRRFSLGHAAADRLAVCGTVAAVPLLHAASEDESIGVSLRRAVGSAIGRIQSRLEGAAAGQLAVAEDEAAGQVSLADSPVGHLSLDEPTPAGQRRRGRSELERNR